MILSGLIVEKKMFFFLEIMETSLFSPCLFFTELSWRQMHDGSNENCSVNL